jgi:hypothetical protein
MFNFLTVNRLFFQMVRTGRSSVKTTTSYKDASESESDSNEVLANKKRRKQTAKSPGSSKRRKKNDDSSDEYVEEKAVRGNKRGGKVNGASNGKTNGKSDKSKNGRSKSKNGKSPKKSRKKAVSSEDEPSAPSDDEFGDLEDIHYESKNKENKSPKKSPKKSKNGSAKKGSPKKKSPKKQHVPGAPKPEYSDDEKYLSTSEDPIDDEDMDQDFKRRNSDMSSESDDNGRRRRVVDPNRPPRERKPKKPKQKKWDQWNSEESEESEESSDEEEQVEYSDDEPKKKKKEKKADPEGEHRNRVMEKLLKTWDISRRDLGKLLNDLNYDEDLAVEELEQDFKRLSNNAARTVAPVHMNLLSQKNFNQAATTMTEAKTEASQPVKKMKKVRKVVLEYDTDSGSSSYSDSDGTRSRHQSGPTENDKIKARFLARFPMLDQSKVVKVLYSNAYSYETSLINCRKLLETDAPGAVEEQAAEEKVMVKYEMLDRFKDHSEEQVDTILKLVSYDREKAISELMKRPAKSETNSPKNGKSTPPTFVAAKPRMGNTKKPEVKKEETNGKKSSF